MEKYIISANILGLSNRIKCLVSSMRIAERCSRKLLLYWPKDRQCNCNFSDLFENEIDEIDESTFRELSSAGEVPKEFSNAKVYPDNLQSDIIINPSWRFLLFPEENCSRKLIWPWATSAYDGRGVEFKYGLIPMAIRRDIFDHIDRLIPKKSILEEVRKFSKNFKDNTISIQVRTWQGSGEQDFPRELLFDIKSPFRIMDREKKNKFFVVCDSEKVMAELLNRYGQRVLFHPQDKFEINRCSVEGIQVSLINLLLMSKSRKLIVSYLSTYSELAWWVGGCKADVEQIPVSLTHRIIFSLLYPALYYKRLLIG